jgi:hypothetical protein
METVAIVSQAEGLKLLRGINGSYTNWKTRLWTLGSLC